MFYLFFYLVFVVFKREIHNCWNERDSNCCLCI